ncbi:MAG: hypothetical protein JXJ17_19480 [Anaerolineae bacterium]|nr:hypothetical protein [Anaerolineae bacterium]
MFNPNLKTRLVIDDQEYIFSPHPVVPTLVWGQEGRHAIVYRMEPADDRTRRPLDRANGSAYALKVFRPAFRHAGLLESAEALSWAHELPGMRVCDQRVLTQESHPDLIAQHEDLDFAMVMPWIQGQTWFDFIQTKSRTTLDQSRALAESLAWVLYALELNQLAHCDLSSGNVIIDPELNQVHLVDVEDLYSPWLTPPPMVPAGTPGYQHREVGKTGQWGPSADRFAGAVLLAEMLGWAHPDIRQQAYSESFFAPDEMQQESNRYATLQDILRIYDPGLSEAFEAAWRSGALEECPPLETWYDLMDILPREPVAEWAPIVPEDFEGEIPVPEDVAVPVRPQPVPPPEPEERRGCRFWKRRQPGSRKGCRALTLLGGVIGLVCCYAAALAVEWSMLKDIF